MWGAKSVAEKLQHRLDGARRHGLDEVQGVVVVDDPVAAVGRGAVALPDGDVIDLL